MNVHRSFTDLDEFTFG